MLQNTLNRNTLIKVPSCLWLYFLYETTSRAELMGIPFLVYESENWGLRNYMIIKWRAKILPPLSYKMPPTWPLFCWNLEHTVMFFKNDIVFIYFWKWMILDHQYCTNFFSHYLNSLAKKKNWVYILHSHITLLCCMRDFRTNCPQWSSLNNSVKSDFQS